MHRQKVKQIIPQSNNWTGTPCPLSISRSPVSTGLQDVTYFCSFYILRRQYRCAAVSKHVFITTSRAAWITH